MPTKARKPFRGGGRLKDRLNELMGKTIPAMAQKADEINRRRAVLDGKEAPPAGRIDWSAAIGYDGWALGKNLSLDPSPEEKETMETYEKWKKVLLMRTDVRNLYDRKIQELQVIGPIGDWKEVITLTPEDPRLNVFESEEVYQLLDEIDQVPVTRSGPFITYKNNNMTRAEHPHPARSNLWKLVRAEYEKKEDNQQKEEACKDVQYMNVPDVEPIASRLYKTLQAFWDSPTENQNLDVFNEYYAVRHHENMKHLVREMLTLASDAKPKFMAIYTVAHMVLELYASREMPEDAVQEIKHQFELHYKKKGNNNVMIMRMNTIGCYGGWLKARKIGTEAFPAAEIEQIVEKNKTDIRKELQKKKAWTSTRKLLLTHAAQDHFFWAKEHMDHPANDDWFVQQMKEFATSDNLIQALDECVKQTKKDPIGDLDVLLEMFISLPEALQKIDVTVLHQVVDRYSRKCTEEQAMHVRMLVLFVQLKKAHYNGQVDNTENLIDQIVDDQNSIVDRVKAALDLPEETKLLKDWSFCRGFVERGSYHAKTTDAEQLRCNVLPSSKRTVYHEFKECPIASKEQRYRLRTVWVPLNAMGKNALKIPSCPKGQRYKPGDIVVFGADVSHERTKTNKAPRYNLEFRLLLPRFTLSVQSYDSIVQDDVLMAQLHTILNKHQKNWLRYPVDKKDGEWFLAMENTLLVGVCMLVRHENDQWWLYNMAAKNQGIGTFLIKSVCNTLDGDPLHLIPSRNAIGFFKKMIGRFNILLPSSKPPTPKTGQTQALSKWGEDWDKKSNDERDKEWAKAWPVLQNYGVTDIRENLVLRGTEDQARRETRHFWIKASDTLLTEMEKQVASWRTDLDKQMDEIIGQEPTDDEEPEEPVGPKKKKKKTKRKKRRPPPALPPNFINPSKFLNLNGGGRVLKQATEPKLNGVLEYIGRRRNWEWDWEQYLGYDGWAKFKEQDPNVERKRIVDDDGSTRKDVLDHYNEMKGFLLMRTDIEKLRKGKLKKGLKVIGPTVDLGDWKRVVTLEPNDERLALFEDEGAYKGLEFLGKETSRKSHPHPARLKSTPMYCVKATDDFYETLVDDYEAMLIERNRARKAEEYRLEQELERKRVLIEEELEKHDIYVNKTNTDELARIYAVEGRTWGAHKGNIMVAFDTMTSDSPEWSIRGRHWLEHSVFSETYKGVDMEVPRLRDIYSEREDTRYLAQILDVTDGVVEYRTKYYNFKRWDRDNKTLPLEEFRAKYRWERKPKKKKKKKEKKKEKKKDDSVPAIDEKEKYIRDRDTGLVFYAVVDPNPNTIDDETRLKEFSLTVEWNRVDNNDAMLLDIASIRENMYDVDFEPKPLPTLAEFHRRFKIIDEPDVYPKLTKRNVDALIEGFGEYTKEKKYLEDLRKDQKTLDEYRMRIEEAGGGLRGLGVFLEMWESTTDIDHDEMERQMEEGSPVGLFGTSWDGGPDSAIFSGRHNRDGLFVRSDPEEEPDQLVTVEQIPKKKTKRKRKKKKRKRTNRLPFHFINPSKFYSGNSSD